MYMTYAEYQAMGGKLTETDFTHYGFMAQSKINKLTQNRVYNDFVNGAEITYKDELSMCMFSMIPLSQNYVESMKSGVSSESNQGMSKSYVRHSYSSIDSMQYEMCLLYLGKCVDRNGVSLMYMGVGGCN